ncbi:TPA: hypothetical protein NHR53_006059 [Pseudomonas aeruginosa]|nr:hypothetical protein [Pseudomonas aeruginosa]HCF0447675.1 hypothetical protein [Pseudomonas aeruginosa]
MTVWARLAARNVGCQRGVGARKLASALIYLQARPPLQSLLQAPGNNALTKLEQTIVDNARRELDAVLSFYRKKAENTTDVDFDDAWREYLGHFNTMNAFLMLAHQANSGLSAEGTQALQRLEDEHAAAHRASVN